MSLSIGGSKSITKKYETHNNQQYITNTSTDNSQVNSLDGGAIADSFSFANKAFDAALNETAKVRETVSGLLDKAGSEQTKTISSFKFMLFIIGLVFVARFYFRGK